MSARLLCLALVLCGCRHPAPSTPDAADDLAELRALAEVARALVDEAAGLCPAASDPAKCQAAAEGLSAILGDVDQLLATAEACQGDDKAKCLSEARRAASSTAPRLALRVARLVVALGRGAK
jgi:alkylation response protein AidB-like acyl-CoA dehydrogenase